MRSAMIAMRSENAPFTQTMHSSPSSSGFTTAASIPPEPEAEIGNVMRFCVWNTLRSSTCTSLIISVNHGSMWPTSRSRHGAVNARVQARGAGRQHHSCRWKEFPNRFIHEYVLSIRNSVSAFYRRGCLAIRQARRTKTRAEFACSSLAKADAWGQPPKWTSE